MKHLSIFILAFVTFVGCAHPEKTGEMNPASLQHIPGTVQGVSGNE